MELIQHLGEMFLQAGERILSILGGLQKRKKLLLWRNCNLPRKGKAYKTLIATFSEFRLVNLVTESSNVLIVLSTLEQVPIKKAI